MARRRFGREEPEQRDSGPAADPVAVAREVVLRLLTARARTRDELERALSARGVPEEAAAEVLDRFGELGLVDDAGFAQAWVEGRQRAGRSTRVIRQELRTKGVDADTIAETMEGLDPGADLRAAVAFAEKRARALAGVEPAVRYRRLAGALARRGFGPATVGQVLREVLGRSNDPVPLDD